MFLASFLLCPYSSPCFEYKQEIGGGLRSPFGSTAIEACRPSHTYLIDLLPSFALSPPKQPKTTLPFKNEQRDHVKDQTQCANAKFGIPLLKTLAFAAQHTAHVHRLCGCSHLQTEVLQKKKKLIFVNLTTFVFVEHLCSKGYT